MANNELTIINGPSKWDLMLSLLDLDSPNEIRAVSFHCQDHSGKVEYAWRCVRISILQQNEPSFPRGVYPHPEVWNFEGTESGPDKIPVKGHFDLRTRKGKLVILNNVNNNPPKHEQYHDDASDLDIIKRFGQIVAVKGRGVEVRLGQKVISNGRMHEWAARGTMGIVVNLKDPFASGRTTDVIDVWFEGNYSRYAMKFKDLQF